MDQTDEQLLNNYLHGDYQAFKALYSRYSGKIYAYLKRRLRNQSEVDEVFQNIFLKLHQQRGRFNPQYKFSTWIFSIAFSCLIDFLRKSSKHQLSVPLEESHLAVQATDSHSSVLNSDEFEKLDIQQKQVLLFKYAGDLTYDEIAQKLGISAPNARQIASRALRRLKFLLGVTTAPKIKS